MTNYAAWIDGGGTGADALGNPWGNLFKGAVNINFTATSFQVSQRGAGANMSVDVATGSGLSQATSYAIPVWSTGINNVAISTADPSNPRNDIIVRYVDLTAYASGDNAGALKFIVVSGTPAASPSDPSDATIQAAVGVGNPWTKLARVVVAAAASSITNANITDLRTPIAVAARLWGGASNTLGHIVPNVADDTVALLATNQTFTGSNSFTGSFIVGSAGTNVNAATSWTPTPTGWTLGTGGSMSGSYVQIGKKVWFKLYILFGTSPTISATANSFSLPVTAASFGGSAGPTIGTCKMYDGSNQWEGPLAMTSTTTATFRWYQVQGSGIKDSNVTSSAPNSWALNNEWYAAGSYDAV